MCRSQASTIVLFALLLAPLASKALAGVFDWTLGIDGDFDDPARWTYVSGGGNTTPPPGAGDSANFGVVGDYEVIFPTAASPFTTSFLGVGDGDVTFGLVIGGSATLDVTGGGSGGDVNVTGGTLSLNGLDLNVADQLSTQGSTLDIQSGSGVVSDRFLIGGALFGDGTVNVDGPNASLTVTGMDDHNLGNNASALLHFSNGAVGDFAGTINLGTSNNATETATITVDGGSMVETGSINAGGLGNTAVINVSGADSSLTQLGAATLTLGGASAGPAALNIYDNGTFTTGTGAVTLHPTSSVTVGDGNSTSGVGTFNANGPLLLESSASLTIDRGEVNANAGLDASDGNLELLRGLLRVTGGELALVSDLSPFEIDGSSLLELGAGATANLNRLLDVGVDGVGFLSVVNGGKLSVAAARVGLEAGSSGFVTVSGTDSIGNPSTLTLPTGVLRVGQNGAGFLTIEDGAHVSAGLAHIGTADVSGGTVLVSGTDEAGNPSRFSSSANVNVGGLRNARLTIEGGAQVTSVFGSIAAAIDSEGTVIVQGTNQSGAPSKWNNSDFLSIGESGNGELQILDGGEVVNVNAFIGLGSLGDGSVTVSDEGSKWTTQGDLVVGGTTTGPRGSGRLMIVDEGLVQIDGTLRIWTRGVITLDGGTLKLASNAVVSSGNLNYLSGTFHLTDAGGYTVGANSGPIDQVLGFDHVSIPNGGGLFVDEVLTVPVATSVTAVAGAIAADALTNDGLVDLHNSTLTTTAGLTNNADLVLIDSTVEGPVNNAAGSTVTVLGTAEFNGLVSGSGSFYGPGTANFNGGMAPGASPAEVSFEGSVALADTNTLFIEIGGTTLGDDYDSLTIAGAATLDGLLSVSLDGFTPQAGQEFTVLTATSITDSGLVLGGPAADAFNLLVGSSSVILQAIAARVPGDYNQNGTVDAADYTLWRNNFGSEESLPNDDSPGVGQDDYDRWKTHFGETAGSAASAGSQTSVPEPAALSLIAAALVAIVAERSTRTRRRV